MEVMTAPIRARITRQPNIEITQIGYAEAVVLDAGWRYEVSDSDRAPGWQLLAAGVVGTQPEALRKACEEIRRRTVA
jgi:hypothetical protein